MATIAVPAAPRTRGAELTTPANTPTAIKGTDVVTEAGQGRVPEGPQLRPSR